MLNCDVNEIFRLVLRQHVSLVVNTSRSNFTEYVTILEKKKKKKKKKAMKTRQVPVVQFSTLLYKMIQLSMTVS